MGEDYKAKIEVVLNNEDHVDMCLNGETTTLQNLAIGVMAQTIALGTDSWDDAKRLLTKAIEGRPGGMALMIMLEETDFYNSPASAKHHLNVPGGLVMHSLNVAKAALELCENMPQFAGCDKNAVLTAALLHDVCKAGNYIQKPDGSYQYRDTDLLGHGEASVINIQHWIHLTEKEVLAIRWHMGAYTGERDWDTLSKAYDRYPEVLCLHMADMIATHIMEAGE